MRRVATSANTIETRKANATRDSPAEARARCVTATRPIVRAAIATQPSARRCVRFSMTPSPERQTVVYFILRESPGGAKRSDSAACVSRDGGPPAMTQSRAETHLSDSRRNENGHLAHAVIPLAIGTIHALRRIAVYDRPGHLGVVMLQLLKLVWREAVQ